MLDTLVGSVAQLCEADMVGIATQGRDGWRPAASYGLSPRHQQVIAQMKIPSGRGSIAGRVILEGKSVQISDIEADQEYELKEATRISGANTILGVPLLRERNPIGIMVLQRRAKQPFTDKQIELAETFADQAVIAIENTRLISELRERTTDLTEALELAGKVRSTRGLERVERHRAFHRQHDDPAEFGRIGEASGVRPLMLRQKILQFDGIARAERDLMAVFDKPGGERLGHIARSQDADFHIVLPAARPHRLTRKLYICPKPLRQKRGEPRTQGRAPADAAPP